MEETCTYAGHMRHGLDVLYKQGDLRAKAADNPYVSRGVKMERDTALRKQHEFFETLHGTSLFSGETIPEFISTVCKAAGCTHETLIKGVYNESSRKRDYSASYQIYQGARFVSRSMRRTFPSSKSIVNGITKCLHERIEESPDSAMRSLGEHFGIEEQYRQETVVAAVAETFKDIVKQLPDSEKRELLADDWGDIAKKCLSLESRTESETADKERHLKTPSHLSSSFDECALSWQELSDIAHEIARLQKRSSAIKLLSENDLATNNGRLLETKKEMVLKNGEKAFARIVGFAHDKAADGRPAGLTFGFITPLGNVCMNPSRTNNGGWEESHLRSWLDRKLLKELPDEVANHIVPVNKLTNNVGYTTSYKSVTATIDRLWLFSRVELCGHWNAKEVWPESPEAPLYDLIADSEGEQYQLFSQLGVDDPYGRKDPSFARQSPLVAFGEDGQPIRYWLRSPDPDNETQFGVVKTTGEIANGYGSTGQYHVLPGFCF